MCERFGLLKTLRELREIYGAGGADFAWEEIYNVPALHRIPVLVAGETGLEIRPMRWGLIPVWAKDENISVKMINARAETVAEKPAYKDAVASRRCVIPASGFYSWKTRTEPFWVFPEKGIFSLCGVWEKFTPADGPAVESCSIITTEANAV